MIAHDWFGLCNEFGFDNRFDSGNWFRFCDIDLDFDLIIDLSLVLGDFSFYEIESGSCSWIESGNLLRFCD